MSYVQPAQSFTLDMVELTLKPYEFTYLCICLLLAHVSKFAMTCDVLSFFLLSGT